MRKAITLLAFISTLSVSAQNRKPFFNAYYISSWFGGQNDHVDQSKWKDLYKDRTSIPYLLDTMTLGQPRKDGILIPKIDIAAGFGVGKLLLKDGRWAKHRNLEWRSTLLYRHLAYQPSVVGYDNYNYSPKDTTRPFDEIYVNLKQVKDVIDWQNMLVYKSRYFHRDKIRLNIGLGLGLNTTISNNISESYQKASYAWSSSLHYFQQQSFITKGDKFKAKRESHAAFAVYLGTEFKLSDKASLLADGQYTVAHNNVSRVEKKGENYWVGLTLCLMPGK